MDCVNPHTDLGCYSTAGVGDTDLGCYSTAGVGGIIYTVTPTDQLNPICNAILPQQGLVGKHTIL